MTRKELEDLKTEYSSLMERLSRLGTGAFCYVTGDPYYADLSEEEFERMLSDPEWKKAEEYLFNRE